MWGAPWASCSDPVNDFAEALRATIAGAAASVLPRRYWGRFELPVTGTAWISAIATIALGVFLGVHGYLRFVQTLGDVAASQAIELSYQIVEGRAQATNPGIPFVSSMLGLFAFVLTPLGFVAAYLVASGLIRALGSAMGQPTGDPLLTLVDEWYSKRRAQDEAEKARLERNALEGPELPDELVVGPEAGFPEADWIVIASRLKLGWERGVFVVTPDRWYRLDDAIDRHTRDGLRRFYVLIAAGQAEVIRRSVFYEHPRLSAGVGGNAETAASAADMAKD